jgi:hypothetical protein
MDACCIQQTHTLIAYVVVHFSLLPPCALSFSLHMFVEKTKFLFSLIKDALKTKNLFFQQLNRYREMNIIHFLIKSSKIAQRRKEQTAKNRFVCSFRDPES